MHEKELPLIKGHPSSPVMHAALGPVQGARGDAAVPCDVPGAGYYGGTRTLSQAVDHGLGQLCLLHHLLNILQLLVIGPPPGSGYCRGKELHCASCSRACGRRTEEVFLNPKGCNSCEKRPDLMLHCLTRMHTSFCLL